MNRVEKTTTKVCPNCGNSNLLLFPTKQLKTCSDCDTDITWYLEPNQQPMYQTHHAYFIPPLWYNLLYRY